MALYTPIQIINGFTPGDWAVGAFDVHNMEYTQAVVKAAETENAPVILMIGEAMIPFANLDMLANICLFAAQNSKVPVAVTLDHGKSLSIIDRCIELGVSIMFDGSDLPFEDNIRLTKEIVMKAHQKGLTVEGELGRVGGSEDGEAIRSTNLTDPVAAVEFVKETGVDILAIAIGNSHGLYTGVPRLDLERLRRIKEKVSIPLVLHGGSDLPLELSREAIAGGIKKFNIGTDLKYAFCKKLKEILMQEPLPYQPPAVLGAAREAVNEVVKTKIRLFGSSGLVL